MTLQEWQNKYPTSFEKSPEIQNLNIEEKNLLAKILEILQLKNLLNDTSLEIILKLASKDYLLGDISDILPKLMCHPQINIDNFIAICSNPEPLDWIKLFLKLKTTDLTFTNFKDKALTNSQVISGINTALNLFTLCNRSFDLDEFCIVSKVVANPLCKAIFQSTTRTFSDYEEHEPISTAYANNLIKKIIKEENIEKQISIFYDSLAEFRVNPCSQKYMFSIYAEIDINSDMLNNPEELAEINMMIKAGINVENIIIEELKKFIQTKISKIASFDDNKQIKDLINNLSNNTIPEDTLNEIIYEIAAQIELLDYYSMRDYTSLMSEIRKKTESLILPHNIFNYELKSIPNIKNKSRQFDIFTNNQEQNKKRRIEESSEEQQKLSAEI